MTINLAKARAFAELSSQIEVSVEEGNYLFKLAKVHRLYQERLSNSGHVIIVNKTRFKEKLLHYFAYLGLQAQSDRKNTIIIFPEGMQQMLQDAFLVRDYDDDRGAGRSIIGGPICIYSCSQTVKTIDFKI